MEYLNQGHSTMVEQHTQKIYQRLTLTHTSRAIFESGDKQLVETSANDLYCDSGLPFTSPSLPLQISIPGKIREENY